jgi:hypothetical protein
MPAQGSARARNQKGCAGAMQDHLCLPCLQLVTELNADSSYGRLMGPNGGFYAPHGRVFWQLLTFKN